jgi:hypothetical protein
MAKKLRKCSVVRRKRTVRKTTRRKTAKRSTRKKNRRTRTKRVSNRKKSKRYKGGANELPPSYSYSDPPSYSSSIKSDELKTNSPPNYNNINFNGSDISKKDKIHFTTVTDKTINGIILHIEPNGLSGVYNIKINDKPTNYIFDKKFELNKWKNETGDMFDNVINMLKPITIIKKCS